MTYYSYIAKGYNELYQEEQSSKLSVIKENTKINKNTKILDVGCGTGISSRFDCKVIGIDPSIELIRQNNDHKVIGIAESLPFKDSSFDYVISVTAIHNFKNVEKSIKEMRRIGRENFVFSVLKKAEKFDFIRKSIEKNFKIYKIVDEGKDMIFFCKGHARFLTQPT